MTAIATINTRAQTMVPQDIRPVLGAEPGDLIAWEVEDGGRATPTGRMDTQSPPEPQELIVKPDLIGCVFQECGLRIDERPAEAYAAFLEEL